MAAEQKLTLGLIARTLGVEDPETIFKLKALHVESLRISRIGDLEALAGTLRELHLGGNALLTLVDAPFAPLAQSLVVLSLARNCLTTLADAGLERLTRLRVLDISHNALRAAPAFDELPTASLTLLDARENPFHSETDAFSRWRVALLSVAPRLEEFDGEPRQSATRTSEASLFEPCDRSATFSRLRRRAADDDDGKARVVYLPLLGDKPGEARRRTVALRFRKGDDLRSLALEFCAQHDVSGEAAVQQIVDSMAEAAPAPRLDCAAEIAREGEAKESDDLAVAEGSTAPGLSPLDMQVERTYGALLAFQRDVETARERARNRASASVASKRSSSRLRLEATGPARENSSAELSAIRRDGDRALKTSRDRFAEGVRRRLATIEDRPSTGEEKDSRPENAAAQSENAADSKAGPVASSGGTALAGLDADLDADSSQDLDSSDESESDTTNDTRRPRASPADAPPDAHDAMDSAVYGDDDDHGL